MAGARAWHVERKLTSKAWVVHRVPWARVKKAFGVREMREPDYKGLE